MKLEFKSRIRNERKRLGLSLKEVAKAAGISPQRLSSYELLKVKIKPEMEGFILTSINKLNNEKNG